VNSAVSKAGLWAAWSVEQSAVNSAANLVPPTAESLVESSVDPWVASTAENWVVNLAA
jgi:hypothetical protein